MDIDIYFNPIDFSGYEFSEKTRRRRIGDVVRAHSTERGFPDLEDIDIAIIGVEEDRNSCENDGCKEAPDQVREYLYRLFEGSYTLKLADLGNIKAGHSVEDTFFALSSAIKELITNKILPVIIGGSQDLTYANYRSYEDMGQIINIVAIDPGFDLGKTVCYE